MNYTPQQFFDLVEEIEHQGGEHLDEMCVAREYELTGPKGRKPGESKTLMLAGCGNFSVFDIPYAKDNGDTVTRAKVKLCAVCDDIGNMPRFGAAFA